MISPRTRRRPLVVVQAVIRGPEGVLLSVRSDLHGWELPGGMPEPGESREESLRREVREETGLEVEVRRLVGDYERTGFLPHTARVYLCRPIAGHPRASRETPLVRWFEVDALPETLFPWYRQPLADALGPAKLPFYRRDHQGLAAIWAGLKIDLSMRQSGNRAGTGAPPALP